MPTNRDTISNEEMTAAGYGWSLGFLKSYPELYSLFRSAVKGGWSQGQFIARVRNSKWYRTHGEAQRQAMVLQKTDPAEWNRRHAAMRAQIDSIFQQLTGRNYRGTKLAYNIAQQALTYGLSEDEIRAIVGRSVQIRDRMKGGLGGSLGEAEQALRKAKEDYGIDLSESWMERALHNIAFGTADVNATADYIRGLAKSRYRAFANQIDQGMTIRDIAEPYRQLMAKTLEISDGQISTSDGTIQRALTATDDKHQPMAKPLWQFETELKNDPRWAKTNGARDQAMSVVTKVLQDWGFQGTGGN